MSRSENQTNFLRPAVRVKDPEGTRDSISYDPQNDLENSSADTTVRQHRGGFSSAARQLMLMLVMVGHPSIVFLQQGGVH